MAYTTHEKIRVEAGFQSRFSRVPFANTPNGATTVFLVQTDDIVKFVPEFGTGGTIAGVSDVQVFVSLSGTGTSQMSVSSVDPVSGLITLGSAPTSGSSLVITFSSSGIQSHEIEEVRKRAESTLNQRLTLCYDLPLSTTSSHLTRLASELAAALLLIRNYGSVSRDTAADGYRLYEKLMGRNEILVGTVGSDAERIMVGEIGLICTPGSVLIDDDGNEIPRNDEDASGTNVAFKQGGRVSGRLYDITDEQFRFKDFQDVVNRNQPGSGNTA